MTTEIGPGAPEASEILEAFLRSATASGPGGLGSRAAEEWIAQHPEQASKLLASLEVMVALRAAMAGAQADEPVPSALSRLDPSVRPDAPPALLREEPESSPPLVSSATSSEGRYRIAGEIARGGMGVVLKGYDVDLAREVAVKVLREEHAQRADIVQRFLEEAQIGGQLQHPGIPPVYDLGVDARGRPFFAMKLVRGRTLAALLHEQDESAKDAASLLSIFASVCRTVAYAHTRGVIHRDLKPANVMVGAFGEVLVLDWGMGKVLPRGGVEEERRSQAGSVASAVRTVRSRPGSGSESVVGSVIGTGPYLSPEQARGETDTLDERVDVFGLGAILCEILTGKPPYVGTTEEVFARAARADLDETRARLAASRADAALVGLATACLAAAREDRPRNGAAVARAVDSYLSSVAEQKRVAEIGLARAEVRVGEERKRRRLAVALAGAVVGLVLLATGGWLWFDHQRRGRVADTDRLVAEALEETARLKARASDEAGWAQALAEARRAEALSRDREAGPATRERAVRTAAEVAAEAAAAQADRRRRQDDERLVERLEAIRVSLADHFRPGTTRREYREVLAAHGLDPLGTEPRAYALLVRDEIRLPLILALGDWREGLRIFRQPTDALDAVLDICDPDPWRKRLRAARTADELSNLAVEAQQGDIDVESLLILGGRLAAHDPERAFDLAKNAWSRRPSDFWANYFAGSWAKACRQPPRLDEALRFASAAVALRPQSAGARYGLGNVLLDRGDVAGAEGLFREALRLGPDAPEYHNGLGSVLMRRDDLPQAEAEVRRALAMRPAYVDALLTLAEIRLAQGDLAGEEQAYRDAVAAAPDYSSAHNSLSAALYLSGKLPEAETEAREALHLDPRDAGAYINLGNVLDARGNNEGAIAAYREAVHLTPSVPVLHFNLGTSLRRAGDLDGAEASLREAARGGMPQAHAALAELLFNRGDLHAAEAAAREEIRRSGAYPEARHILARILDGQGEFDRAETEFRELLHAAKVASRSPEDLGWVHGLGKARVPGVSFDHDDSYVALVEFLIRRGQVGRAQEVAREAVEACPASAPAWYALGAANGQALALDAATAAFERSRALDPRYSGALAERNLAQTEQLRRLVARLGDVLAGRDAPRDMGDASILASMAKQRGHYRAAADISAAALRKASPEEALNECYNAACYAAIVGTDPGADSQASEAQRAAQRASAIQWLRVRLRHLERLPRARRWDVVRELRTWQRDPDLAGLRGSDALARLPEGERTVLQAIWDEVERLAVDRAAP